MSTATTVLRCACSPDADDLFMFRALLLDLIDTEGLRFEIVTRDTDLLNRVATAPVGADDAGLPDVTAISIAHYPAVAAHYQLLNSGGSVGRNYGPVVIALPDTAGSVVLGREGLRPPATPPAGASVPRISVPGLTTTACLVLRMYADFEPVVVPIAPPSLTFDALRSRAVDASLVIHEGRLTYADEGCVRLMDIGERWFADTGLPLPLGGNVIRRGLGADVIARADRVLRASIAHALEHREEAISWLLERPSPLRTRERVDHYLSLYANADSLDYGEDGRRAVKVLLDRGAAAGWLPSVGDIDFVGV